MWRPLSRIPVVLLLLVVATPAARIVAEDQRSTPRAAPAGPAAAAVAEFERRIAEYMQLHKKLEAMLPKLPKETTPQQIDQNQRALAALVSEARANAKPGDIFTAEMQRVVHQQFARIFVGREGDQLRRYIHDEPHPIIPEINKRYPDNVPLSTMPLPVLKQLPALPDELEYRFVDSHLILMDVHAHLILDYVRNAIPPSSARQGGR